MLTKKLSESEISGLLASNSMLMIHQINKRDIILKPISLESDSYFRVSVRTQWHPSEDFASLEVELIELEENETL